MRKYSWHTPPPAFNNITTVFGKAYEVFWKVFGIWEGMWGVNLDRILTSQSFTLYDLWHQLNNNINIDKSQYVRYFGNSIS